MYIDQPFQNFFNDLASEKSSPGGGSVSALTGVQAVSLVLMVANLTLGKKKYETVQSEIEAIIKTCSPIKASLMSKVDEDIKIFQGIMDIYNLPKEERDVPMQEALKKSAQFSFSMINEGFEIVSHGARIAEIGNKNLISDAAIAVMLGISTIESAMINVRINLKPLKDSRFVENMESEMKEIYEKAKTVKDQAYKIIEKDIQVG